MPNSPKLLLDENLSWRVARGLTSAGYQAITTGSLGLNGLRDAEVFRSAQQQGYVIVTRDSDFLTNYAPPHNGIVVVLCSAKAKNAEILTCLLSALPQLATQDLTDIVKSLNC